MIKTREKNIHMKYLRLFAAVFIVLCVGGGANAENEFHISNEFGYTYNDIYGPGSDNSSLTPGWRYLNVFGFNGQGSIRDVDYNFNLGVKTTDDKRNDVTTWSLTNMQGRMTNKVHTVNVGDTFESFSQYSLSTALKGGSYRFFDEKRNSPEITLVYGWAYPRWDNIYGGLDTRAIAREAYGVKIKQNFTPAFWLGASFVEAKDQQRSRVFPTDQIYSGNNYTLDGEYKPIPGLTVKGEFSFSHTRLSQGQGDVLRTHGGAYKIEAIGDGGPSRVSIEYEKVATEFYTILGAASPDREKAKGKWRYKIIKDVDMNLGMLWYRDNLDGQKAYRTDSFTPEASFTFRNFLKRDTASIDLGYRYDRKYGGSAFSGGLNSADHIITLNYRDRYFDMIDSDANFGYTVYSSDRYQRDAQEYVYNLTLNSRHALKDGEYVLKPMIYLGSIDQHDALLVVTDRIYEYSAGLGLEMPKLRITTDAKLGQNRLEKGVPGTGTRGDNSSKTFANLNIYYKPQFLSKLNTGMLYLRFFMNDFRYSTMSNNFRENSVTMGMNIQY
jgi:hypothetical protein